MKFKILFITLVLLFTVSAVFAADSNDTVITDNSSWSLNDVDGYYNCFENRDYDFKDENGTVVADLRNHFSKYNLSGEINISSVTPIKSPADLEISSANS